MSTRVESNFEYKKNPNFGQPGEPEMLAPVETQTTTNTFPLLLTASGFQDVCETGLGGGATGRARLGTIDRAMEVSLDDEVRSVFRRYNKAVTFEKPKAAALFTLLVSKTVMTAQERTNILAAWPEA